MNQIFNKWYIQKKKKNINMAIKKKKEYILIRFNIMVFKMLYLSTLDKI